MKGLKRATPAILRQMKAALEQKQAEGPEPGCCETPEGRKPAVVRFVRTFNGVIAWAYHACGIEILEVNVYTRVGFRFGVRIAHGQDGGCKPLAVVAVHFRRQRGRKYYIAYTVADCCRHQRSTCYYAI